MKRVLSLVLALVMVLGMIPTFAAEMTGAEHLKEHGFISGGTNGDLMEANKLTREQLAAVMSQLYGEEDQAAIFAQPADYSDWAKVADWAKPYVAYNEVNGWMQGNADGSFNPQGIVSAQQLAALLLKVLGYDFTWSNALAVAGSKGLVIDGAELTRGQAFDAIWTAVSEVNLAGEEQTLGVKLGKLTPPVVVPTALEVASIVALNNKQIDIKFNKAVDATEAVKLTNYTVGLQGALATNVADGAGAKAVVLEDGMTVRLTLENGANFVNSTTTNKVVVKKEIGMAADFTKADLAVLDTTVPGIESVKTTGPKQITITFTEPMDRSVSAANTVSSFSLNNGTVTLDPTKATYVDADRTLTLETYITIPEAEHTLTVKAPASNNMKDYAGYQLPATSIAFTHVKDTTAPTATLVSNTETTATLKFNKVVSNVNAANVLFRHTYNSGTYQVTGAAGATNPSGDGMTWVINFGITMPFPPGASTLFVAYNSATGTLITDNWGNEFVATSFTLNTLVDNVKPEVVSVTFKTATTLEVLFSETVDATTAQTVANYVLKDTAATPATLTVSNAVLGVDNKTVTLTTAVMNGGTYNLTVKNVKDASLAANTMVEVTVGFTATDTIPPTVVDKDTVAPGIQVQQVAADKVRVEFSEAMNKASIENKANWKYDGLALPSTATVVATDDLKSVIITITGLDINKDLTLGVVTDASGLAIAAFSTTLDIIGVTNIDVVKAEVIAKNQVVIYFDEIIVGSTTADFEVSLNNGGVWAAPTAISVAIVEGKTQITLTPSADITDTSVSGGNEVLVRTVSAPATPGAAANSVNTFGTPVQFGAETALDKFVPKLNTKELTSTTTVEMTYSEAIKPGSVSIYTYTITGKTVTAVSVSGATVEITFTTAVADLAATVSVTQALNIEDMAGNKLAPSAAVTVKDNTAPTVTNMIVAPTALVANGSHTLGFSEELSATSKAAVKAIVDAAYTANGTATVSSAWVGSNLVVTFTAGADPNDVDLIALVVPVGFTVTDLAGNVSAVFTVADFQS